MNALVMAPSRGMPTYEEFYGLHQPPFSLAPDPQFLYPSESHREALHQLLQALDRNEGFVALTGDIGTGKTTISRALMAQLPTSTFTSLILNSFVSADELLREILLDFGIISRSDVRSGHVAGATAHQLISTLHEFLSSLVPIGGRAVLIIDEAQQLSPAVLEQVRVIANVDPASMRLLQVVLVGQPTLLEVLARAEMKQLDQRISLRARLTPLTRPEVEEYIAHRLHVARGASAIRFEPSAIDAVHDLTSGVPRPINLLCDRALMLGAGLTTAVITAEIVERAARALDMKRRPERRAGRSARQRLAWLLVGAALLLLGLLAASYAL